MRFDVTKGTLAAALIAGACAGCTGTGNVDALRVRAAFDFQCDREKLQLTQLAEGLGPVGVGAVYGVTGCGHRGAYVRPSGTGGSTWVLNSGTGSVDAIGTPPPPVVAPPTPPPQPR
jgi:hypothetical protein